MATPKKIRERPVVETLELVMREPEVIDQWLNYRLLKARDGYEIRLMPQRQLVYRSDDEQPARIVFENLSH